MANRPAAVRPEHYKRIYELLQAPVAKYDCGKKCAPLNNGEPVCCSTQNAVPVMHKQEYALLKTRTDLWHNFKPYDAATRKIVKDLHGSCQAVECKGVQHCERDNRSLACRAFPFFPYFTKEKEFIGLTTYWTFEDRCWMMSNMQLVEPDYVLEFVAAYEYLFTVDHREYETFVDWSAVMRRVFSRQGKDIPIIKRDGTGYMVEKPHGAGRKDIPAAKLPKYAPFTSDRAYARAIKAENGVVPEEGIAAV